MSKRLFPEQLQVVPQVVQWFILGGLTGALAGSASALLLAGLAVVTQLREIHPWLIPLLPLGGALIGWIYWRHGRGVEAGSDLIIDEIHDPKAAIPLRMAPLILVTTLLTHLFGGSAGREGTAVQMGGSLADQLTRIFRLQPENRRILLMAGMSAGFASVFGRPLAGAVFGMEVLAIGRLRYEAIWPCFVAAWIGHEVTLAWGIRHDPYGVGAVPALSLTLLLSSLIAGACFGLTGSLFAALTRRIARLSRAGVRSAVLRPALGGALVAAAVWACGTTRYLGLGLPTIAESFTGGVRPYDFAAKLGFTALTLGVGLKGGEVTPLFFMGSTLGNALAHLLPLPAPLLAGMGLVAVFAGAANVPIAGMLLGMEAFGSSAGLYCGIACVAAYLFSGHAGIYHSQRLDLPKGAIR